MWTWEQERRRMAQEPEVQLGKVTLSGETAAVNLGGERRWLTVCSPGGYSWRPREGEQVVVLKPGSGEASCVLGTTESDAQLQPGQVRLQGGRCAIRLGDVLELTGDVALNGQSLEEYIRGVIADALSGG